MLNRSASVAMSTSVLKALPGKLDIKRHSPSILYFNTVFSCSLNVIFFLQNVVNQGMCPQNVRNIVKLAPYRWVYTLIMLNHAMEN